MTTTPYQADAAAILTESHGQVARAVATHPEFDAPLELSIISATVEWDSTRAPRVTGQLTVVMPDDAAMIAALDPNAGVRVEMEAGYVRPGGVEDVAPFVDLGLRRAIPNHADATMRLELAGDEMLVIDASPAASASVTDSTTRGAISKLLAQALSPAPIITSALGGPAVTVDPVADRWDTIKDLSDRIGAETYDDGLRRFVFANAPTVAATPDLTLTVGQDGTVLEGEATFDREDFWNYVYIRYEWRTTAGVDKAIGATAVVTSGTYAITGPAGKRILIERREVPTTQAEANAAAKAILQRTMRRAVSYRVRAIAAYWARPGMTVRLTPAPGLEPSDHILERVTFNFDGTMSIATRLAAYVDDLDTTTPPPVIPTDPSPPRAPDPAPPARQTYVSEWVSNASRSFKGDGSENSFIAPEMGHGYYSGTNGNQFSITLFTAANSTGDETGKTITQALTGATLSKVEVWAYASHWNGYDGGTARLGYYNGTSLPASASSPAPYVTVPGWRRETGRWVTITSKAAIAALLAGTARGVTFGKGVGTDREYYGKFNGASSSSNKPKLRLTYAK